MTTTVCLLLNPIYFSVSNISNIFNVWSWDSFNLSCPIERKSIINLSIVTRQPPAQDRLITMLPFDSVSNSDPKILFFSNSDFKNISLFWCRWERKYSFWKGSLCVCVTEYILLCRDGNIQQRAKWIVNVRILYSNMIFYNFSLLEKEKSKKKCEHFQIVCTVHFCFGLYWLMQTNVSLSQTNGYSVLDNIILSHCLGSVYIYF